MAQEGETGIKYSTKGQDKSLFYGTSLLSQIKEVTSTLTFYDSPEEIVLLLF